MNLYVDKNSDTSIYNQLVNQIIDALDKGILKPGERLPAQREISAGLCISRGTIQKAYEELERRGIVEILKGSGCFISKRNEFSEGDRKKTAIFLIDELLNKLADLNYTNSEIHEFVTIRMLEKENKQNYVRIAAIDCNPEALETFKIQISSMKNIHFRMFILDDILKYSQPDQVFEDYDIIITTLNHYDELSGILYTIREKLFKAAVSPASDTIINIATIPSKSNVGIITKSIKFRDIMLRNLASFNIEKENIEHAFISNIKAIKRFLKEKDFLIVPQSYILENRVTREEIQNFIENGGKVIEFVYQIERGSLIYIEEQIENVMHCR